jgi:hypothetical protein
MLKRRFACFWVAQNGTKSQKKKKKKTAQSRRSSSLCHFLVRQGIPALSVYYPEILYFSRENRVIPPKFQSKTSIFIQKRQKYPPLTPTCQTSFPPKKRHNLEEGFFCATKMGKKLPQKGALYE